MMLENNGFRVQGNPCGQINGFIMVNHKKIKMILENNTCFIGMQGEDEGA